MLRLFVHVEGQTEEEFVNSVLREHLLSRGYLVSAHILGEARTRSKKRGIPPWPSARRDILNHLKQDPGCIATTIVDYYGMPQGEHDGWPGRQTTGILTSEQMAQRVEDAIHQDVVREMGPRFDARRFVPFVMMHEFEGLLFSDCGVFCRLISRSDLEPQLRTIRDSFPTPEDINDSPLTAPSKRLLKLIPTYDKIFWGVTAALEIGLDRIRRECPHFNNWLSELESLGR
jgi:hypothetical protein